MYTEENIVAAARNTINTFEEQTLRNIKALKAGTLIMVANGMGQDLNRETSPERIAEIRQKRNIILMELYGRWSVLRRHRVRRFL
jgi:hypothetical protein